MGIDPGAAGALALLNDDGELQFVRDMPVVVILKRRRVVASAVAEILREWKPRLAIIEKVFALPASGAFSMLTFGYAAGVLEGACAGLNIPVMQADPKVWKKAMGVTKDKGTSLQAACRMWPGKQQLFARKMDDGRAESALIAAYHIMQWQHAA